MGILYKDQQTCMIISGWIILKNKEFQRNVQD